MKEESAPTRRKLVVNVTGVESLQELPSRIQKQAVRKMRDIEAAPASIGYPLRKPLHGFRGIHSGRYRIIWRLLTLQNGEEVAEVVYVGIRKEGNERDAYAEFAKLFGLQAVGGFLL